MIASHPHTFDTTAHHAPVAMLVATIANSFGIGGAVLFSPCFVMLFPLVGARPIATISGAFTASLITESVGFGSGLVGVSAEAKRSNAVRNTYTHVVLSVLQGWPRGCATWHAL